MQDVMLEAMKEGAAELDRIPERMVDMPVWHGMAVPWITPWLDDTPRFGVYEEVRRQRAIIAGLCGQCGNPLDYWKAAVADHTDTANMLLTEPVAHEDCMRYAIAVCPYLARATYRPHPKPAPAGAVMAPWSIPETTRAERMFLIIFRRYRAVREGAAVYVAPAGARTVEEF